MTAQDEASEGSSSSASQLPDKVDSSNIDDQEAS